MKFPNSIPNTMETEVDIGVFTAKVEINDIHSNFPEVTILEFRWDERTSGQDRKIFLENEFDDALPSGESGETHVSEFDPKYFEHPMPGTIRQWATKYFYDEIAEKALTIVAQHSLECREHFDFDFS